MSIRVGNQQDPFGRRVQVSRLFQQLRAVHLRHLLIGQQERHWLVVQAHLLQLIQRLPPRIGFDDAKAFAIVLFQVMLEFMQDLGESSYDHYCGSGHRFLIPHRGGSGG